ncbi:MAG: hypothetical protein A2176_09365 [Spirochaetes bacterium RBG_13_51_14]|nr:MAG: hypothetical protein A2176_09365 [Spirochaetes bacterium RBG_13_51_14]
MEKQYKQWIVATCLLALIVPGITAGINYYMDPLWCFSLSHRYNQKQDDFNERQQKTNFITFHDFDYQGLVMGSSTSTNINQHSFKGIRVYNYAINGLQPAEYLPYIRYARKRNGRDFDYIFMGVDFLFATTLGPSPFDPEQIFSDTNGWLYRVKILVSLDTLKFSRRNFMNYLYGRHIYYDRNNTKLTTILSRDMQEYNMKMLMEHIETSPNQYSFKNFKYNKNYHTFLDDIRDKNPASKFIVFTTPVIEQFLKMMVKYNLLDDYLHWIREIVEIYGECYHFMYPTDISKNYMKNFHDPNHYYPFVADMMVDAIHNKKITGDTDFGMYINRSNIEEKCALLERLMRETAAR